VAELESKIECGFCGADLNFIPWEKQGFYVACGGGTGQTITTDPPMAFSLPAEGEVRPDYKTLNRIGVGGTGVSVFRDGVVLHACGSEAI
jgi:hypothetical protein